MRNNIKRFRFYALVSLVIVFIIPIIWLLLISIKTQRDAFAYPPLLLFKPTFEHYLELFGESNFIKYYLNSILVALGTIGVSFLIGVPAAYKLGRTTVKAKSKILLWVLITRMMPRIIYLIPFFMFFITLGLIDTIFGLIIAYQTFSIPLVVWTLLPYFETIPNSLEESAKIDGASEFQVFRSIMLPLAAPGLTATAVLVFINSWNEFLWGLILTRNQAVTAPIAVMNFMAFEGTAWGKVAAGGFVVLLPTVIFSIFIRQFLVRGTLGGAVKE